MDHNTGKYIIILGGAIIFVGIIVFFFYDKLHWLGRLPGDVKIEKGNTKFYFPIVTMLLLSILISLILFIIRKFF